MRITYGYERKELSSLKKQEQKEKALEEKDSWVTPAKTKKSISSLIGSLVFACILLFVIGMCGGFNNASQNTANTADETTYTEDDEATSDSDETFVSYDCGQVDEAPIAFALSQYYGVSVDELDGAIDNSLNYVSITQSDPYDGAFDFDNFKYLSDVPTLTITWLETDYSFLGQLSGVKDLSFLCTDIDEESNFDISGLTNLESLCFYDCKIYTDISDTFNGALETLSFTECTLKLDFDNIEPGNNMMNSITFNNNKIIGDLVADDTTGLDYETISLNDHLDMFENFPRLENLMLQGEGLTDVSALANVTELDYLDLSDNDIKDVSCLLNLKGLSRLILNGNPITEDDVKDFNFAIVTTGEEKW